MTTLPAKSSKLAGPSFQTFLNGIGDGTWPFWNCADTAPASNAPATRHVGKRWNMVLSSLAVALAVRSIQGVVYVQPVRGSSGTRPAPRVCRIATLGTASVGPGGRTGA